MGMPYGPGQQNYEEYVEKNPVKIKATGKPQKLRDRKHWLKARQDELEKNLTKYGNWFQEWVDKMEPDEILGHVHAIEEQTQELTLVKTLQTWEPDLWEPKDG